MRNVYHATDSILPVFLNLLCFLKDLCPVCPKINQNFYQHLLKLIRFLLNGNIFHKDLKEYVSETTLAPIM